MTAQDPQITQLLDIRKEHTKHYEEQRYAYLSGVDVMIRERLLELKQRGFSREQLLEVLGTKNNGTLKYYLNAINLAPKAPLEVNTVIVTDNYTPNPTINNNQPQTQTTVQINPHVTFDPQQRKLTATNVPWTTEYWDEKTLQLRDIQAIIEEQPNGFTGYAYTNEKGKITSDREPLANPFVKENDTRPTSHYSPLMLKEYLT